MPYTEPTLLCMQSSIKADLGGALHPTFTAWSERPEVPGSEDQLMITGRLFPESRPISAVVMFSGFGRKN